MRTRRRSWTRRAVRKPPRSRPPPSEEAGVTDKGRVLGRDSRDDSYGVGLARSRATPEVPADCWSLDLSQKVSISDKPIELISTLTPASGATISTRVPHSLNA